MTKIIAPNFPKNIYLVNIDNKELESVYKIVNSTENAKSIDQNTSENLTEIIISYATKFTTEFFKKFPQEKLNLIIPPMGSLPLTIQFINKIRKLHPEFLDKFNFIYALAIGERGEKKMKCFEVQNNYIIEFTKKQTLPALMIEDIFDSLETFELVLEFFPKLIGLAPIGKGKSDHNSLSTFESYKMRFNNNSNNIILSIINLSTFKGFDNPSINLATCVENVWIDSGFGLNGGTSRLIKTEDLKTVNKLESLERLSSFCIYNSKKEEKIDLMHYQKALELSSTINIHEKNQYFEQLIEITAQNNLRKVTKDNKDIEKLILMINNLLLKVANNEIQLEYKR